VIQSALRARRQPPTGRRHTRTARRVSLGPGWLTGATPVHDAGWGHAPRFWAVESEEEVLAAIAKGYATDAVSW